MWFNKKEKVKTFTDYAEDHYEWVKKVGWANTKTPLECLMLIVSEASEAADELREEVFVQEQFEDELADIVLRTMGLSKEMGIDLESAIKRKITKNKLRGNKGRIK